MWYVLLKYVVYKVIISLIYTKLQALSSIKKSRFFVTSQQNQIDVQQLKNIKNYVQDCRYPNWEEPEPDTGAA